MPDDLSLNLAMDRQPERPPTAPGKALKELFEGNFGFPLSYVSQKSGIDMDQLSHIVDGSAKIDRPVALKLKSHFGDVAEVLLRLQFVYDYFERERVRPPSSLVYEITV